MREYIWILYSYLQRLSQAPLPYTLLIFFLVPVHWFGLSTYISFVRNRFWQSFKILFNLTSSNTGLLLLMSLMPTMTWAELLRGSGPPAALSSVAVTLRTYWGPRSLGGGLRRSLMMPVNNSIKHFSSSHCPCE